MNEFNSELSFQDIAQESKVKKLLNKAKIQGSMDFTFLSSEEQRQVKEWFQDHLKELDPEDRTEILENVLMREPVEETTVLSVISTLPDKQKQQLGEFLGFVLKDPSNAKAFQQCWHLFSPDQKDELVEFYTRKEPQNAIMVAKYVDVTKIVFEVDEKKETLMERSFQRKEQVHALLEQLTEESGNETSLERTERLLTLKLVVNAVSEKNPLFLVDYLDRLIPLNMVPKLIMDRILNRDNVWLLEKGKELLAMDSAAYRHFILSGIKDKKDPFKKVYAGCILGGAVFIKDTLKQLQAEVESKDFAYKRAVKNTVNPQGLIAAVSDYFKLDTEQMCQSRSQPMTAKRTAIYLLRRKTGLTNAQIGELFDMKSAAVSKAAISFELEMKKERALIKAVEQISSKVEV